MNFREYRRKETIRAAEISEGVMKLQPRRRPDSLTTQDALDEITFNKGDYVELSDDGDLFGWIRDEFERSFTSVRAPRQSKTNKRRAPKQVLVKEVSSGE